MDNKQNRQFYWEVKDFMNKNPNTEAPIAKKPSVVNSVKSILEQNNVYKQNSFNAKSNTVNTVSQVIKTVSSAEKGYDPSCVAYTKNQDVNGFKLIKEGIFDDIYSSVSSFFGGSNNKTPEQLSRQRARQNRIQGAAKLTPDQFNLERDATGMKMTSKDIQDYLDSEDGPEQGSSEQSNALNLMDRLSAEENASNDGIQGGDYSTKSGASRNKFADKFDLVGSMMKRSPSQATSIDLSKVELEKDTPTAKPEDSDFVKSRKAAYQKRNLLKQREAEEKLVRMGTVDVSKLSQANRATYEVNKLRAQRAAQGEDALSDEEIQTRIGREVKTKDRQDREKNVDVSSRLASKYLLNLRDKEGRVKTPQELEAEQEESKKRIAAKSAPKVETGTKTASASETSLDTYRA
jgi:hypothetical protein